MPLTPRNVSQCLEMSEAFLALPTPADRGEIARLANIGDVTASYACVMAYILMALWRIGCASVNRMWFKIYLSTVLICDGSLSSVLSYLKSIHALF